MFYLPHNYPPIYIFILFNCLNLFIYFSVKYDKKIYLFSDLGSPFGNDQLEAITNGLKSLEIHLTLM